MSKYPRRIEKIYDVVMKYFELLSATKNQKFNLITGRVGVR